MPIFLRHLLLAFSFATLTTSFAGSQQPVTETDAVFETASIRPSHLSNGCFSMLPPGGTHYEVTCLPLRVLIAMAWKLNPEYIQGGDAQALDNYYDIRATTPDGEPWAPDNIPPMLRQLLEERFHIAAHGGTKQVSGYGLIVAKGGSKLKPVDVDVALLGQKAGESSHNFLMPGRIQGRGTDLGGIASLLSASIHAPVVDHTGINGIFNVDLHFAPENGTESNLSNFSTAPDFFTAIEEQLGLKLHPEKVTIDTLVIDHVDRSPTPN
jgi:uncharacterized protein (TIGR03435 family)